MKSTEEVLADLLVAIDREIATVKDVVKRQAGVLDGLRLARTVVACQQCPHRNVVVGKCPDCGGTVGG